MPFHALKLLGAFLWRAGYLLDRSTRLAPTGNIKFKTPLVGVGSLLVGGAGKTPVARIVAKFFAENDLRVGLLCYPTGDENLWNPPSGNITVISGRDRWELCKRYDGHFDVLVSDDGFEDHRLAYGYWIRLDWGELPGRFGDLIPCGKHRSFAHDHSHVRCVLRCAMVGDQDADPADLWFSTTMPRNANGQAPDAAVVAMAGVARPERFFRGLERAGVEVCEAVSRPDHDRHFGTLLRSRLRKNQRVAITAKDAARLAPADLMCGHLFVADLQVQADRLPWADLTALARLGTF